MKGRRKIHENRMTKNQKTILIVVALIVFGGLIYLISSRLSLPATGEIPAGEESAGEIAAPGVVPVVEQAPPPPGSGSTAPIPRERVNIRMSDGSIELPEFTVSSGAAVTLSVTSVDDKVHIFKFRDQELSGVALGVGPGETLEITFNAPGSGVYDYYCGVKGHDAAGENGKMTVVE